MRMLTATDLPTSPAHTEISQITDWRAGGAGGYDGRTNEERERTK